MFENFFLPILMQKKAQIIASEKSKFKIKKKFEMTKGTMDNLGIVEREQNHQKKTKVLLNTTKRGYKTSVNEYILVLMGENLTVVRSLCPKFR